MDIEGIGDVMAAQLTELGLVHEIADIYTLDEKKIAAVPRTGEKTIANLLRNIERSKSRGLARVLTGLGIRFVGTQTAQILAGDFGSIDDIAAASAEELQQCEGIGPEVASSVSLFFAQRANRAMIERLRKAGVSMTAPKRPRAGGESWRQDVRPHRHAAESHARRGRRAHRASGRQSDECGEQENRLRRGRQRPGQ